MKESYTPPEKFLEKYAELIVRFGLQTREGKPLKKGSVVQFIVPEVAKPLYFHLQKAILRNDHHPLGVFLPSNSPEYNFDKNFFDIANPAQVEFFADSFHRGLIDQIDGTIFIIADTDAHALKEVDPKKVLRRSLAQKQAKDWKFEKIDAGKLCWTIAMYGTEAAAKEAGMSLKDFWKQIINACYLNDANPVRTWKGINDSVQKLASRLTAMRIESLHFEGPDMDLKVGVGHDRKWMAGGGNNIPSYEVFTSPNRLVTEGWARFNQPHYHYGKKIEGIELWFKGGKVVRSSATKNHDLLKAMLKTPGGNMLGEVSLTDARHSRITKFMAETLYDENIGGRYGNTHIALGSAYREGYLGNPKPNTDAEWEKLGFNNSVVHSDIISTTDRTVTATLSDGTKKVIYKKGRFTI
jgi:aminopeptidase